MGLYQNMWFMHHGKMENVFNLPELFTIGLQLLLNGQEHLNHFGNDSRPQRGNMVW